MMFCRLLLLSSLFVAFFGTTCSETDVTPSFQCTGENFDDLSERFQVVPCGAGTGGRCILTRNTTVTVIIKFNPTSEVKTLVNEAAGILFGVSIPFDGVDGTQVCGGNITVADTGKPIDCPLPANQEYIYTNFISVLNTYPKVNVLVHWGLRSDDNLVICAEVLAVIKAAKKSRNP